MNTVERAVLGGQVYFCIQVVRVKEATYEK